MFLCDMRSDTVTRPSIRMRQAMAEAAVGDDVYGDDPTTKGLEAEVAKLLGKETGLFLPSGTQSNLVSILTHCGRGEEYITGSAYHVARYEAGGAAVLGGVSPFTIPVDGKWQISPEAVTGAIKEDDIHFPITKLLCLENTVYGEMIPQDLIEDLSRTAHDGGISVHLDGARLLNASVKTGLAPDRLAASADSVSLCLSKGLGAPIGSVLVGPADFIARARRNRKILGGGMRQVGHLAAAGLYALENNIERLADDHARAKQLAEALSEQEALDVHMDRVQTNMVYFTPDESIRDDLRSFLKSKNVLIGSQVPTVRCVLHLDINDDDLNYIISSFKAFFEAKRGR